VTDAVQPAELRPVAAPKPAGRLDAVDWFRGLAVVLMIQTHLYDAWCSPAAKHTAAYAWTRYWGGIPSRLFLLLVGVSMAIGYESQIRKAVPRPAMVRKTARRGLEILGLAYLFRVQEYILGGWGPNWPDLFRVDILNCIGASMIVASVIAAPRNGKPAIWACLVAAAAAIALGPILGPHHFPSYLPRPITSYLGGERPMSWFPLFPWVGWVFVGVVVGHYWVRQSATAKRQAIAFLITGVVGYAMVQAVTIVRRIDPHIIRYPSDLVQQMGPGTFFHRLGWMGPMALGSYLVARYVRLGFSPMRQLGQTSLLVYWVHVELVYGYAFARLHGRLSMTQATVALVLMTAAMVGVSVLRTKYWRGWPWGRARAVVAAPPAA
jgi:uncharacterized membrane protein